MLGLGAAGCGGGASEQVDGGDAADEASVLAHVARIDDSVDVRVGAEEQRVDDAVVPVRLGDAVRTDGSGFAEVRYATGSVARLDVLTEFTVVELADGTQASVVRAQMGVGRTWHRVRELTGDDTYEVETSVAVAAVRGTTFVITCPDVSECTFNVYEGLVEVRNDDGSVVLGPGEALTVRGGEPLGSPTVAPALSNDPWLVRNAGLDGDGLDDSSADEANAERELSYAELSPEEQEGTDFLCDAVHNWGDPIVAVYMVTHGERLVPALLLELAEAVTLDDQEAGLADIREACVDIGWVQGASIGF